MNKNKTKYNWAELKTHYMASAIMDVLEWGRVKLGTDKVENGNFKKQTYGWRGEKEEMLKIREESKQEQIKNDIALSQSELEIIKWNIVKIAAKKIEKDQTRLSTKSLRDLYNIIKIELGEPILIGKQENVDTSKSIEEYAKKTAEAYRNLQKWKNENESE